MSEVEYRIRDKATKEYLRLINYGDDYASRWHLENASDGQVYSTPHIENAFQTLFGGVDEHGASMEIPYLNICEDKEVEVVRVELSASPVEAPDLPISLDSIIEECSPDTWTILGLTRKYKVWNILDANSFTIPDGYKTVSEEDFYGVLLVGVRAEDLQEYVGKMFYRWDMRYTHYIYAIVDQEDYLGYNNHEDDNVRTVLIVASNGLVKAA